MFELARAKVNLSLHVVGKRADGLHLLDSIVVFPELGDVLRLADRGLTLSGPFANGLSATDNLVLRAGRLAGYKGGFQLEKNLPVASGIGGGSADAAAALRLVTSAPVDAATLGADVPACVLSKPLRMEGAGADLTLLPPLPAFAILLVNGGEPVATPQVFVGLENVNNPPAPPLPVGLSVDDFFAFIGDQRNDMQAAATRISPVISAVLAALQAEPDCALARMSGSGGTCFGLFKTLTAAKRAEAAIKRQNPGWWVAAARV